MFECIASFQISVGKQKLHRSPACDLVIIYRIFFFYNTLAKTETATQAKHRRVHAREITRLRHARELSQYFWPG